MTRTWWNGEPCEAERGTVVVGRAPRATWWCAELEGTRRRVVRVTYAGQVFYLDNDGENAGTGWRKVTTGKGWPDTFHASVPVDAPDTWRPA